MEILVLFEYYTYAHNNDTKVLIMLIVYIDHNCTNIIRRYT
jgi:hypothetical protein